MRILKNLKNPFIKILRRTKTIFIIPIYQSLLIERQRRIQAYQITLNSKVTSIRSIYLKWAAVIVLH